MSDTVSKVIKFAGISVRITLSSEVNLLVEKVSSLSGLSYNYVMLYVAKNDIVLFEKVESDMKETPLEKLGDEDDLTKGQIQKLHKERLDHMLDEMIFDCFDWTKWSPADPNKNSPIDYPLKLNMRLRSQPVDQDPIRCTLPKIASLYSINESRLLKELLYDFLQKNKLINLENYSKEQIRSLNKMSVWMPYLWPVHIIDFEDISDMYINDFSILLPGKYKDSFNISIRFNKGFERDQVMHYYLPTLCSELWRTPSALFQMLYLCFLCKHSIVNQQGHLLPNYLLTIECLPNYYPTIESALK